MSSTERPLSDDRMRAEIAKLIAETSKINAQARWYPLAVATALVSAIAGMTAMIIKLAGF